MIKRGFSLIELIIACVLVVFGLLVFFSVFATSTKHSTQTRNSTVAQLLAMNMLEEFEAHSYGAPAPRGWSDDEDLPAELWIQGREHEMIFHKSIEFDNGSFVGQSDENSDLVTLTISWREGVGEDVSEGANSAGKDDNKELKVQVPVWR